MKLSSFLLVAGLAFVPLSSFAIAPVNDTKWMLFASSGPGKPDGYVNAQVKLQYAVLDCPGQISLAFRVVPGSVQAHETYWYGGGEYPSSLAPVPATPHVQFLARVMYRSTPIAQVKFFGASAITPNSSLGCAGGVNIGRFSDYLPAGYGNKEKEKMFENIEIWLDTSPLTLQNPALHAAVKRQQHEKKAAEMKAAEQAKRDEEERTRKLQQEQQMAATRNQGATAAQPTRHADGSLDFWSAPSAGGQVGSGHREGHGSGRPATAAEVAAARKAEEERELRLIRYAERQRAEQRTRQAIEQTERTAGAVASALNSQSDTRSTGRRVENLLNLEADAVSLDALDDEIARRMAAVEEELWALRERQREAINVQTQLRFSGGSQVEQSVGELTNLLVNMAQEQQRQNAIQEAERRLEAERERIEREIVARGRQLLVESFTEGKLPLSSTKVPGDTLYFFAIRNLQPQEMTQRYGQLLTIKPFPITRRGDGSWPLPQRVNEELQAVLNAPYTLVGFYTSEDQANRAYGMMQSVAEQTGLQVYIADFKPSFARKGQMLSAARSSAPDFWMEGSQATASKVDATGSEADFWSAGSSPAATRSVSNQSSGPDFWSSDSPQNPVKHTDSGADAPDFWKK